MKNSLTHFVNYFICYVHQSVLLILTTTFSTFYKILIIIANKILIFAFSIKYGMTYILRKKLLRILVRVKIRPIILLVNHWVALNHLPHIGLFTMYTRLFSSCIKSNSIDTGGCKIFTIISAYPYHVHKMMLLIFHTN